MGQIRNILQVKGQVIFSVPPGTTVYNALEKMFEKNVSALLIMDNDTPAGIFTERDYARNVALKGRSSRETMIEEIMTKELITVTPEFLIEDAMRLMTNKFIRHLPVLENNKLIGIVSIGDVVKYLIEEQRFIIGSLENYIGHT